MAMMFITHDLGVVSGRTADTAVHVRAAASREGTHPRPLRQHEDAVHRGAEKSIPRLENPSTAGSWPSRAASSS